MRGGVGQKHRTDSRPGVGTLTCHDSHVAVAVAEGLHQRGHVRQQPQGGLLAKARGHFLPLGHVQVLNFTGQTHQLGGRGVREDSSDPGLLTPTSGSRPPWAAKGREVLWGWVPRRCSLGSSEHLTTGKGSLLGPLVFFSLSSIFPCSPAVHSFRYHPCCALVGLLQAPGLSIKLPLGNSPVVQRLGLGAFPTGARV